MNASRPCGRADWKTRKTSPNYEEMYEKLWKLHVENARLENEYRLLQQKYRALVSDKTALERSVRRLRSRHRAPPVLAPIPE